MVTWFWKTLRVLRIHAQKSWKQWKNYQQVQTYVRTNKKTKWRYGNRKTKLRDRNAIKSVELIKSSYSSK